MSAMMMKLKQEPMQEFIAKVNAETKMKLTRQEVVDIIKKYPISQDSFDRLFNQYVRDTSKEITQVPKEKV